MQSLVDTNSTGWRSLSNRFRNNTFLPFPAKISEDSAEIVLTPNQSSQYTIVLITALFMSAMFVFIGLDSIWRGANEPARVAGCVFAGIGVVIAIGSVWVLLRYRQIRLNKSNKQIIFTFGIGWWRRSLAISMQNMEVRLSLEGPGSSFRRKGHVFLSLFNQNKGNIALAVAESREAHKPACGALAEFFGTPVYDDTLTKAPLPDGTVAQVSQASTTVSKEETSFSDASFRTYKLKFTSSDIAQIMPTGASKLFVAWWFVFALLALAMIVLIVVSAKWPWWMIAFFVLMPCSFMLLGITLGFSSYLELNKGRFVIDRQKGIIFRGRENVPKDNLAAIALEDIIAIQVCTKKVKSGGGRYGGGHLLDSYQLNLVLRSDAPESSRLTLMAHCNGKHVLEDANRLSVFLKKPLLASSTA